MRKGRIYLLLLAVVVAGVPVLIGSVCSREPAYGGRILSQWLPMLSAHPDPGDAGAEAIRHIGSNAVPYLLKWTRYEPPAWKAELFRAINRVTGRFQGALRGDKHAKDRAEKAMFALMALGPQAESAVGELSKMLLETNNPAATRWTALALAAVGKPGLPPLVTALTNSQTISLRRCYMTGSLGAMGTNAQSCIPALQHALEDSNWIVRVSATNVLRRIQPQAPGEGDGQ